ncbi:hypothetical protein IG631_00260 [Alternaria alternata]|nr:hypothetical protein IG631_00260 [Alternaria alternata]
MMFCKTTKESTVSASPTGYNLVRARVLEPRLHLLQLHDRNCKTSVCATTNKTITANRRSRTRTCDERTYRDTASHHDGALLIKHTKLRISPILKLVYPPLILAK